jgi:hypothetical protein
MDTICNIRLGLLFDLKLHVVLTYFHMLALEFMQVVMYYYAL